MKSKFAIPCVGKWRRKKILEINILFLLIKNKFKPHFANVKNCLDSTNTLHFLDNALYQPIWRKECVYYHFKYHCISNFEKYIDLVCGEQKVAYLWNGPKILFNWFVHTCDLFFWNIIVFVICYNHKIVSRYMISRLL